MWGTLFKQASRLAQEGYSREEVKEILKRAAELQAQAESEEQAQQQGQINRDALRAGAMAAGIRPEFLDRLHCGSLGHIGCFGFEQNAPICGAVSHHLGSVCLSRPDFR
ncbi:MAG: hypothetical protein OGMRLDGQ_001915 [Candidatus Fervidibacter sp.]